MYFIKLCCVFAAIITVCYARESLEVFRAIMSNCKAKTGATEDDIAVIMQHVVPVTRTGICFAGCVKKEMKIMNEDNTMNLARIEEILSGLRDSNPEKFDNIMKIVHICANDVLSETDECEASKKIMQCFMNKVTEMKLEINFMDLMS